VITAGGCIGIVALEPNFLRLDRRSVDGPLVNPRRLINLSCVLGTGFGMFLSISADIFIRSGIHNTVITA